MTIPQPRTEPEGQMWVVWSPKNPQVGDAIHYAEAGEPIPADHSNDLFIKQPATRGTTNGNSRGSTADRRKRRAWIMETYASNIPGYVRCYRCGCLLFNPDDHRFTPLDVDLSHEVRNEAGMVLYSEVLRALTIDRIIPGVQGGTYRRTNIRPACAGCNSETGGALSRLPGKRKK